MELKRKEPSLSKFALYHSENFLKKYIKLKPTNLEILESIDMLRILENGYDVKLVETNEISIPVDRKEDILKVESF